MSKGDALFYSYVGSLPKIPCVAAGNPKRPWRKLRRLDLASVKKTAALQRQLDEDSLKNKSALRGINKPNGGNWSSHLLARSKKIAFSWNSQIAHQLEQPISFAGRGVCRQCQGSFAAFQRAPSIQSCAVALFL